MCDECFEACEKGNKLSIKIAKWIKLLLFKLKFI